MVSGKRNLRALFLMALTLSAPGFLRGAPTFFNRDDKKKFEEYETRAALLLAIVKYTEWPPSALPPGSDFVFGVLGDSPLGPALERQASGMLQGRKVVVKRFRTAAELQTCHVLYFPAASEGLLPEMRNKMVGNSVLTVGETSFFMGYGGGLQVFPEEGRLRFVVNKAVLDQSNLRVAARALNLAKQVLNQL